MGQAGKRDAAGRTLFRETGGLKMSIPLQARPAPSGCVVGAEGLWDDHPHQSLKALGGLVGSLLIKLPQE